jgi:hypothetical protein
MDDLNDIHRPLWGREGTRRAAGRRSTVVVHTSDHVSSYRDSFYLLFDRKCHALAVLTATRSSRNQRHTKAIFYCFYFYDQPPHRDRGAEDDTLTHTTIRDCFLQASVRVAPCAGVLPRADALACSASSACQRRRERTIVLSASRAILTQPSGLGSASMLSARA